MIKVIAFDLVGVLVHEKDVDLTLEEEKLERLFGDNIGDADYLVNARKIISKDSIIMQTTLDIINKLYTVDEKTVLKKIKTKYPDIKLVIATNHVSYVRDYIGENIGVDYIDNVIISAEIHKTKPGSDFFEYILDLYNIKPRELLFLDDSKRNIDGANSIGIKTIKVNKDTNIYKEICLVIENK